MSEAPDLEQWRRETLAAVAAGMAVPADCLPTETLPVDMERIGADALHKAQAALESLVNQLKANGELTELGSDEEAEFREMEGKALCALGWVAVAKEVQA